MPVWKFEVHQCGKENVQSVGLRPFIVSQMLECGFEHGDAINSADGMIVSILVECPDRETAQNFRKRLAVEIRLEARSEYSNLPKKFKITLPEKANNPNSHLPALTNKAPALTLSQTSKGVGVMIAMHRDLSHKMDSGFRSLTQEMDSGFRSLTQEMRKGFSKLPERTARAIADVR